MADKKYTYLGPSELFDAGDGEFQRVPKGGLEVSLSENQFKSLKGAGHRFEGHDERDVERAQPSSAQYNRNPQKYAKEMNAVSQAEEPADVGAGLGITTTGDSGASVTNDDPPKTTARSRAS